jgi:hypothetical protein
LKIIEHKAFEVVIMILILANAALMGLHADWIVRRAVANSDATEPESFTWLERFFLGAFCIELMMRVFVERIQFIVGVHFRWNILDCVLVGIGLIEQVLDFTNSAGVGSAGMSNIRLLRILRLVRIVRLIRIMRFFRELRLMVSGIHHSLQSLFWAMVLLLMMMFMFAVYAVQVAADELQDDFDDPFLRENYGSVVQVLFSLFKIVSYGANWGPIAHPLTRLNPIYALIYVLFIAFAVFAVLNVVTGVFVETAMQTAQHDVENLVLEEMLTRRQHFNMLRQIFSEVADEETGEMTWEDFSNSLENEFVLAFFRNLGLDMHEPRDLFREQTLGLGTLVQFGAYASGAPVSQGQCADFGGQVQTRDTL